MHVTRYAVGLGLLSLLCLLGCGDSPQPTGNEGLPPTPEEFSDGQTVYEANCGSCHDSSRDGSPRLGFLRAWSKRLEQGETVLAQHAREGIGLMPPRGDNPQLTDEEILSAVRYMVYRANLDIPAGH